MEKARNLGIGNDPRWNLAAVDSNEYHFLESTIFRMPFGDSSVALLDTSLTIRKYYNIHNDHEMGRLLEHMTAVLPRVKSR